MLRTQHKSIHWIFGEHLPCDKYSPRETIALIVCSASAKGRDPYMSSSHSWRTWQNMNVWVVWEWRLFSPLGRFVGRNGVGCRPCRRDWYSGDTVGAKDISGKKGWNIQKHEMGMRIQYLEGWERCVLVEKYQKVGFWKLMEGFGVWNLSNVWGGTAEAFWAVEWLF